MNDEFILKDAEKIWALTVGIFGIGAVIGALIGGKFADKFGRKNTMKWNTVLSVVACSLQFFSKTVGRVELLILGRVLIGISSVAGLVSVLETLVLGTSMFSAKKRIGMTRPYEKNGCFRFSRVFSQIFLIFNF